MARTSVLVLLTVVTSASLLLAQTTPDTNMPGMAREKLNYFAGTWTLEVHMNNGPLGSKVFIGTEHNEWMPGGSLLLSRQEGSSPISSGGLTVLAYNAREKTYTYHVVKGTGEVEDLRGTLEGTTWTWTSEKGDDKSHKIRLIIKEISPQSYSLRFETAFGESNWFTLIEGRAHKTIEFRAARM